MKSSFDFKSRTEATREARRWSWTKKSGADCLETSKLEIPPKKRFVLLTEELKFAEFLEGAAGQRKRKSRTL